MHHLEPKSPADGPTAVMRLPVMTIVASGTAVSVSPTRAVAPVNTVTGAPWFTGAAITESGVMPPMSGQPPTAAMVFSAVARETPCSPKS